MTAILIRHRFRTDIIEGPERRFCQGCGWAERYHGDQGECPRGVLQSSPGEQNRHNKITSKVRTIFLPSIDKRVSLGVYVRAIKLAQANLDAEFKTGLTTWWPTTGREIMDQFREGMHDRINQRVSYVERGGGR